MRKYEYLTSKSKRILQNDFTDQLKSPILFIKGLNMNVVITGSTRGIGYGLAEEFLKAGHNVLIHGRDRMVCGEVYNKLRFKYPNTSIHIYACDITCYNSLERMFWEANRYFGSVDIWINNAGMAQNNELFYEHDKDKIDQIIDVNIKGVIYGTKAAAKQMKDKGGYIYNMEGYGSNDMMGDNMTYYGMTKRALTYFTKSAAKEARNTKVKIGTLSPGMVVTELLIAGLPENEKDRKRVVKMFNILADKVEVVTPFLVNKMLKNRKNRASITWLTNRKAFARFLLSMFRKRDLFS